MKKLHQLAQTLKENNFEMTPGIKEQFEEFISIIAKGSRIYHSRFGLGTVVQTQGEIWVGVEFDDIIEEWEERRKDATYNRYYGHRPVKFVHITSCLSIHMLIKKETERLEEQNMKDMFGL